MHPIRLEPGQPGSSLLGTRARTGIEWELLPGKEVGGFGAGKKLGAVEQLITDFSRWSTPEAERADRAIMTKDGGAKVAQRSTLPMHRPWLHCIAAQLSAFRYKVQLLLQC